MNPFMPPSVRRARTLLETDSKREGGLFDLSRIIGRVVEISESGYFGALSAVCGLMSQVQRREEQIAWIETGNRIFFPPDLAFRGLDVRALSVVLAPETKAGLQAADALLRSGAFGLILVDWAGGAVDEAVIGRMARVAEDRETCVLFLTRKRPTEAALATQVSLRGTVSLSPAGETEWLIIKDKRSGPPSRQRITFHGPFGLY
jgi:hypothetical protein